MVFNIEGSVLNSGSAAQSLAVVRDVVILRQIWPALMRAQHSDKPEIQMLVDRTMKKVETNVETCSFDFPVSPEYSFCAYF